LTTPIGFSEIAVVKSLFQQQFSTRSSAPLYSVHLTGLKVGSKVLNFRVLQDDCIYVLKELAGKNSPTARKPRPDFRYLIYFNLSSESQGELITIIS
jgi:hypothetical protein